MPAGRTRATRHLCEQMAGQRVQQRPLCGLKVGVWPVAVSGSSDGNIKTWDLLTGTQIGMLHQIWNWKKLLFGSGSVLLAVCSTLGGTFTPLLLSEVDLNQMTDCLKIIIMD